MASEEKKKVTRVFQMSSDTAMMFFVIVKWSVDHGVKDTPKMRQYVLDWLGTNGYMDRVYDTKRSQEEVVSGYKSHGYNIQDYRKLSFWKRAELWLKRFLR